MTAGGAECIAEETAANIAGVGNAHGILDAVVLHLLKYLHPVLGGNRLFHAGLFQIVGTNQRTFADALRLVIDHCDGIELAGIGGQVPANVIVALKNGIVVGGSTRG